MDQDYIDSQVALETPYLTTPGYADAQDNLRAHKTAVDAADTAFIPLTELGVPNGVSTLGIDVYVPPAQLPTLHTERPVFIKNMDTQFLTANHEVTSSNPKEYQAGSLTIPDLGYPYIPLLFAVVQGGSLNGTTSTRAMGTGNYAQLSILRDDDTKFGWAITTGQKVLDFTRVLPSQHPAEAMVIQTSSTFGLWAGMHTGTTYTFTPTAFQFYAIAFPAI